MMERLTYKQAYDKIIDAYFKDEIRPLHERFCFCGTLNNNSKSWNYMEKANVNYSYNEFKGMEVALLNTVFLETIGRTWKNEDGSFTNGCVTREDESAINSHPNYENALFTGMSAALDVLKQIHIERGEVIDEPEIKFTKINLQPA